MRWYNTVDILRVNNCAYHINGKKKTSSGAEVKLHSFLTWSLGGVK